MLLVVAKTINFIHYSSFMETIKDSDICGICMDESNRDFLFKTCCTFLMCRVCYNKLEIESFPKNTKCAGCRKEVSKITLTTSVVDNTNVPVTPCGKVLSESAVDHINNCVQCLRLIVHGNNYFEEQVGEKFKTLKRKLDSSQDEVYAREQCIRDLTYDNRQLKLDVSLRNKRIRDLQTFLLQNNDNDVPVPAVTQRRQDVPDSNVSVTSVVNHLRLQFEQRTPVPAPNDDQIRTLLHENEDSQESFSETDMLSDVSAEDALVLSSSSSDTGSNNNNPQEESTHAARVNVFHTPERSAAAVSSTPPIMRRIQRIQRHPPLILRRVNNINPTPLRRSQRVLFRTESE
jgi:hypothetical protein